jgi:hypothetical protein
VSSAIKGPVTGGERGLSGVNGRVCDLKGGKYILSLRLILVRRLEAAMSSSRLALGLADKRVLSGHIGNAPRESVPEGFEVLEGENAGDLWRCPIFVVEPRVREELAASPRLSYASPPSSDSSARGAHKSTMGWRKRPSSGRQPDGDALSPPEVSQRVDDESLGVRHDERHHRRSRASSSGC